MDFTIDNLDAYFKEHPEDILKFSKSLNIKKGKVPKANSSIVVKETFDKYKQFSGHHIIYNTPKTGKKMITIPCSGRSPKDNMFFVEEEVQRIKRRFHI